MKDSLETTIRLMDSSYKVTRALVSTEFRKMDLKVAEGKAKASPKGEFQIVRERNQENGRSKEVEAIAKRYGGSVVSRAEEDGVVRMKMVMRKEVFNQMLESMRGGNAHRPSNIMLSFSNAEQRLQLLAKKHHLRANLAKESGQSYWSPALQSIPEERYSTIENIMCANCFLPRRSS